jgi:hypothetical protein
MANGVLPYDNDDHFANTGNEEANSYCPNNNPFITFAGRQWWINYHWSKESGTYVYGDGGTFKSIFNPKIIEKDGDAVRLWIRPGEPNEAWQTSEIVLTEKLGLGRYLITARADCGSFSDLDPNAVFGAFTYQYSEAPPEEGPNIHRELDMLEVLRGGSSNAQFTLQPWSFIPTPWEPFMIPPNTPVITAVLDWRTYEVVNRGADFTLYRGDYSLKNLPPVDQALRFWAPRKTSEKFEKLIPSFTPSSCARFHLNLWLMKGNAPATEQSVTVTRFEFDPQ